VAHARHAVTDALPADLRDRLGPDLGLLTSELVTNAVRYGAARREGNTEAGGRGAGGDFVELVLWAADGHYWVAVSDPGTGTVRGTGPEPGVPVVTHPDPDSERGRGLLLVDHIATTWTVRHRAAQGLSVVAGLALR
jgi:anti-sigma regulatory factor (Ser/Thr protein kinase)